MYTNHRIALTFILLFGLTLSSCSFTQLSVPTVTLTPMLTTTATNSPVPQILTSTPMLTTTATNSPVPPTLTDTRIPTSSVEKNDYLVYLASLWGPPSSKSQLTLYDPANNDTQVLPANGVNNSFSLSKDNRLAFEKDGNIFVWNYPFTKNTPKGIILDGSPATQKEVLSWSLDGRYLLLTEGQADSNKLLLWDGKNILDIYNYQGVISSPYTTWSNNGKLAFTERLINTNTNSVSDFGEIFVWDGKDIVNVSQNPSTSPAWSKDGQLAFLSYQNGEYVISVWDSKSKNKGAPDIKTLAAPDLKFSIYSFPTWTNSGSIVFIGSGKTDGANEIYEWDGRTTRNISQTPSIEFDWLAWRNDGYWSAPTYQHSSPHYAIYVRDNANRTVLETEGTVSNWTQSGLLVFCSYKGNSHTLSIWNGRNIVDLAHGDSVIAKWTNSNGKYIWCTYG